MNQSISISIEDLPEFDSCKGLQDVKNSKHNCTKIGYKKLQKNDYSGIIVIWKLYLCVAQVTKRCGKVGNLHFDLQAIYISNTQ